MPIDRLISECGELERRWEAASFDEHALPEMAGEMIERLALHEALDGRAILEWVRDHCSLPTQRGGSFSDFEVQVYSSNRLEAEFLFWFHGAPGIHDHAFSGAFSVIQGRSVHTEWTFEEGHRFNSRMMQGKLEPKEIKILHAGEWNPIALGNGYIHSLYHVEVPSITLLVRAPTIVSALPQLSYAKPGFAYDLNFMSPEVMRKASAIEAYRRLAPDDFVEYGRSIFATLDVQSACRAIYEANLGGPAEIAQIIAPALERYPSLSEMVITALFENERKEKFVHARGLYTAPDHRLFLGILQNVDRRSEIYRLLSQEVPDAPPERTVARIIGEMAAVDDTLCEGLPKDKLEQAIRDPAAAGVLGGNVFLRNLAN